MSLGPWACTCLCLLSGQGKPSILVALRAVCGTVHCPPWYSSAMVHCWCFPLQATSPHTLPDGAETSRPDSAQPPPTPPPNTGPGSTAGPPTIFPHCAHHTSPVEPSGLTSPFLPKAPCFTADHPLLSPPHSGLVLDFTWEKTKPPGKPNPPWASSHIQKFWGLSLSLVFLFSFVLGLFYLFQVNFQNS